MSWNNRVLKSIDPLTKEDYFAIHEVYYDESGNPNGYTEKAVSVGGDSIHSLRWTLNKMLECLDKPILTEDDFK